MIPVSSGIIGDPVILFASEGVHFRTVAAILRRNVIVLPFDRVDIATRYRYPRICSGEFASKETIEYEIEPVSTFPVRDKKPDKINGKFPDYSRPAEPSHG